MKITVIGSLGNIGKQLTPILVGLGHEVTVVTSKQDKTSQIEAIGAKAAIGSIADVNFLTEVFTGADAIYTMVPPDYSQQRFREYVSSTNENYARAIQKSGVKRVVHLSSIGADIPEGAGLVTAIRSGEFILNQLEGVNITYLRAGLFYTTYKVGIATIKDGYLGNNYGNVRILLAAAADIALAAAEELQLPGNGKNYRYVVSEDTTASKAAHILGEAIGLPELKWKQFTADELRTTLEKRNMPYELISAIIETGTAVNSGVLWQHFDATGEQATGKTKLADFGEEFAATASTVLA